MVEKLNRPCMGNNCLGYYHGLHKSWIIAGGPQI